jgi:hypothetical protein
MPTWPTDPMPDSVDDSIPVVPLATFVPDQPGYEIRRRPGTTVRSPFLLTYGNLTTAQRNTFRHFIANEINFGADEFDWTMPMRNAMTISSIATDTVTTAHPHGYTKGQWVAISGTSSSDGNYRVSSVTSETVMVLAGLSGTESSGTARPHLPKALLVLEQNRAPGYDKIFGPVHDDKGVFNWTVPIIGVNA